MDKTESWIILNYDFINSILKPENRLSFDIFEDLQSNIDIICTNIMIDSIDSLVYISTLTKQTRKYHNTIIEFMDLYMPEFFNIYKEVGLMNYYKSLYESERNKLEDKLKKDKIIKKNIKLSTNLKKTIKFKKTKSK